MTRPGARLAVLLPYTGLLLASPLGAVPLLTEEDLFGDIPTVNAVSRFEQRLDRAPASVTIITREMIEMSGAQSIVEIFRLVPGFQSYYVTGNRYGISYHGIGREFPNQIEVMVDGRSVYETLFSSVNWGTLGISLADIDHIEVVRGSNAAAHGSNALMGAVNIITRKPVQDGGTSLSVTGGDLSTRNATLVHSDSIGDIAYRLSLGYDRNEGFPAVDEGPMDDGRELGQGNVQATYTPTVADTVHVALGYAHDRLGWGDADHPDEFDLANSYGNFQSVNWTHALNSDHEFEVQAYHNRFKTNNLSADGPLYALLGLDEETAGFLTAVQPAPPQIVALFSRLSGFDPQLSTKILRELNTEMYGGFGHLGSERFDLQFQHTFNLSERLRGTWGLGARYDALDAFHPQSPALDINETNYRLFSHQEWQQSDQLTWNLGVMVEDTRVGTLISPRISANIQLTPKHAFRGAYARGNRAPSLYERNENSVSQVGDLVYAVHRVADPDLREETIDTYELAYMFQPEDSRLSLDVRVFREELRDVIDEHLELAPLEVRRLGDRTQKLILNWDYWELKGGEVQLSYQVTPATYLRVHYTHLDFDAEIRPPSSDAYAQVYRHDMVATHSGGILLGHQFSDHWSASVTAYGQPAVNWLDGNFVDGFSRVDAQLAYAFTVGGASGKVRLIAQNIGETYSEFNVDNRFETRYFLNAQLDIPD